MFSIEEVFKHFEKMNAYTFATINGDCPETRVAHLLTYDHEGLYFQTMKVKPFYKQLQTTGKVAVCSLVTKNEAVTADEDGLPTFPDGFFIRLAGDVKEVNYDVVAQKASINETFTPLLKDIQRYPTMTTFVICSFTGEYYQYDFEKKKQDHKIKRLRFGFNSKLPTTPGFHIQPEKCIACGMCKNVCTFDAIQSGDTYSILPEYCDECGSCYTICPRNAIVSKNTLKESDRQSIGQKVRKYYKENPLFTTK